MYLYAVHTCGLCDLCDLLCFNKMPTKLYSSTILSTASRDHIRQCEIMYDTHLGDLKKCAWSHHFRNGVG